jgi:hypothetical protein
MDRESLDWGNGGSPRIVPIDQIRTLTLKLQRYGKLNSSSF